MLCGTRCTRRSLLVTVPSASHQVAAAGSTTSASSAVAVKKMSCTTRYSSPSSRSAACLVGFGLGRVLADDVEATSSPHPSRRTSGSGSSPLRPEPHSPRALKRRRHVGNHHVLKPGSGSGIAPMSPPPWTLFWPRSGLRPRPVPADMPGEQREVDQRVDVVDRVVMLGDAERPADHARSARAYACATSRMIAAGTPVIRSANSRVYGSTDSR